MDDLLRQAPVNQFKKIDHSYINKCRVLDVYDGDTVVIGFIHNGELSYDRMRIIDIDTPELRSKEPIVKEYAYYVKNKVKELFNDFTIYDCKIEGRESFGRLLGDIILNSESTLKEYLLTNKYAVPFKKGNKKMPDSNWIDLIRSNK